MQINGSKYTIFGTHHNSATTKKQNQNQTSIWPTIATDFKSVN
jgi:hypothetical protein